MPITVSVTRGKTMGAGEKWTPDDWNAAFLPTVNLAGGVGASDLADDCVTAAKLSPEVFNGLTVATALAVGDFLPFYDLSAGDNAKITVANAINGVFSLAPAAVAFTSYTADLITFHNGTAAAAMTPARFAEQLLAQAPALTAIDVADEVLVHDASAADGSQAARVTVANLLPDVGTAGTVTGITGITTDAKGRVTGTSTTGAGQTYSTADGSLVALPTSAGSAGTVSIPHGLGAKPRFATISFVCTDAGGDAGYAQNTEKDARFIIFDDPAGDYNSGYVVGWDATNITVTQPDQVAKRVPHATTGAMTAVDTTKWKVRGFAMR